MCPVGSERFNMAQYKPDLARAWKIGHPESNFQNLKYAYSDPITAHPIIGCVLYNAALFSLLTAPILDRSYPHLPWKTLYTGYFSCCSVFWLLLGPGSWTERPHFILCTCKLDDFVTEIRTCNLSSGVLRQMMIFFLLQFLKITWGRIPSPIKKGKWESVPTELHMLVGQCDIIN